MLTRRTEAASLMDMASARPSEALALAFAPLESRVASLDILALWITLPEKLRLGVA